MRRHIPENSFALPPMGWCVNPSYPPIVCSWCGEPVVDYRDLIICPTCDPIEKWPEAS